MVSECVKWSSAFPAVLGDVVAPEGRGIKIGFSVLVAGKSGIQGTQPRRRQSPKSETRIKTHHNDSLEGPSHSNSQCFINIDSLLSLKNFF